MCFVNKTVLSFMAFNLKSKTKIICYFIMNDMEGNKLTFFFFFLPPSQIVTKHQISPLLLKQFSLTVMETFSQIAAFNFIFAFILIRE